MILILGDVHGQFVVINEQIKFACENLQKDIEAVIVLGDMGIYKETVHGFFDVHKQEFLRKVYFLDGNHEDFANFYRLIENHEDSMTFLPRGHITSICDIKFLSLGGASYMDALNSPPGSEIKDCEINRCLEYSPDEIDAIITHDCPCDIGVPNSPGFEFHGPPGFKRSGEILTHFAPRQWFFGHHHRWFTGKNETTSFFGMPEAWKGFGILDQNQNFTTYINQVKLYQGWLKSLIEKLRIKAHI